MQLDLIACRVCGVSFDPSDLTQVIYHEGNPHKPVLALPQYKSEKVK